MNAIVVLILIVVIITALGGVGYMIMSKDSGSENRDDIQLTEEDLNPIEPPYIPPSSPPPPPPPSDLDTSNNLPNATIPPQEDELPLVMNIEPNGRCGPKASGELKNNRCMGKEYCNKDGHCGIDETLFKYAPYSDFSGPESGFHDVESPYLKICGPDNDDLKCREADICNEIGQCVPFSEEALYDPNSAYAGPESCYNKPGGCIPSPPPAPPEKEYECAHYTEDDFYDMLKLGGINVANEKTVCSKKGVFTHGNNEGYKGETHGCWCLGEKGTVNNPEGTRDEFLEAAKERINKEKGLIDDWESGDIVVGKVLSGVSNINQEIKFTKTFEKPPKIFISTQILDTRQGGPNIRYNANVSNVTTTGFKFNLGTWGDSTLYSPMTFSWVAIESEGVKTGNYVTDCWPPTEKNCNGINTPRACVAWGGRTFTHKVKFAKPFNFKPEVILGITGIDANSHNANLRLTTSVSNITKESFDINITTWCNTIIYLTGVYWLAVEPQIDVRTGTFRKICWPTTVDCNKANQQGLHHSNNDVITGVNVRGKYITKNIAFKDPMKEKPIVIPSLAGLDMYHGKNYRLKIGNINSTKDGFSVQMGPWADSVMYSGSVSFIALT